MGLVQTVARKRAQIRTSPPLLAMSCSCVPAFPIGPTHTGIRRVFEPVPIAFGEVSKLSEIEQPRIGTHFECVRKTRWGSTSGFRPANPESLPATALGVTSSPRIYPKNPVSLFELGLKAPLFELLSPSVVIRRRPQRMQGLRVT